MKVSELIKALIELHDQHGDMEVMKLMSHGENLAWVEPGPAVIRVGYLHDPYGQSIRPCFYTVSEYEEGLRRHGDSTGFRGPVVGLGYSQKIPWR